MDQQDVMKLSSSYPALQKQCIYFQQNRPEDGLSSIPLPPARPKLEKFFCAPKEQGQVVLLAMQKELMRHTV